MPQFMLLLHENPADFASVSPDEIQAIIGEYVAWRQAIEAAGKYAGSNKLKDEGGRHLTSDNGHVRVVDGPYAEASEVIGGYFNISAADYDEAVEITRGCPHLKYGGWIELRQIEDVPE
ncbi:MAG: YciI family protein [Blastocatellia bacterium]